MLCIELFESAFGSGTYWFNPKTKEIILAADHGEAVRYNPEQFGIDPVLVQRVKEYYKGHDYDGQQVLIPFLCETDAIDENDAWERLGLEAGWVRIGEPSRLFAGYLTASTAALMWHGVKHVDEAMRGTVYRFLELEIVTPSLCKMYTLKNDLAYEADRREKTVGDLLKAGPKGAAGYLDRR